MLRSAVVVLEILSGNAATPLEELRLAVPGLAGIAGLLLFPAIGAWLRLALQFLEWNRPGIRRPRRIHGLTLLRAVVSTILLSFFVITLFRAASELRDIQAEAPVVAPSIQGMVIGIAIWAIYAIGVSALRADARRRRSERRAVGFG